MIPAVRDFVDEKTRQIQHPGVQRVEPCHRFEIVAPIGWADRPGEREVAERCGRLNFLGLSLVQFVESVVKTRKIGCTRSALK